MGCGVVRGEDGRGVAFLGVCVTAWWGLGSLEVACGALSGLAGFFVGEGRSAGSLEGCGGFVASWNGSGGCMVLRRGDVGCVTSWKGVGGWAGSADGSSEDSQLPLLSGVSEAS